MKVITPRFAPQEAEPTLPEEPPPRRLPPTLSRHRLRQRRTLIAGRCLWQFIAALGAAAAFFN